MYLKYTLYLYLQMVENRSKRRTSLIRGLGVTVVYGEQSNLI